MTVCEVTPVLLRLNKIIEAPGSVPFTTTLDLRDCVIGAQQPVTEPVEASGVVRNVGGSEGVLQLTGEAHTTLHCVCDRCARPFTRAYTVPLDAVLTTEIQEDEDEWTFLLKDDCADLDDIILTHFLFGLDMQLLCREDCSGLCPICGQNLNDAPCGCAAKKADPRLAVLAQLLKDKPN